jgi:hypothetical protein
MAPLAAQSAERVAEPSELEHDTNVRGCTVVTNMTVIRISANANGTNQIELMYLLPGNNAAFKPFALVIS